MLYLSRESIARGTTPIEKNVIVVDEHGNEYEATYPRRARGLVKKGRARFIEEQKICLACPPKNLILEERTVSNDNNHQDNMPELTMPYILQKLDQIANDTAYLHEVISALQEMKSDPAFADNPRGDNAGAEKAEALSQAVKAREETNRQFIELYKQMYQDLRGPSKDKITQLQEIAKIYSNTNPEALDYIQETIEKHLGLSD